MGKFSYITFFLIRQKNVTSLKWYKEQIKPCDLYHPCQYTAGPLENVLYETLKRLPDYLP